MALIRAVESMRSEGSPIAGLSGALGLEGVERFAAAYPSWPETFGDELPAALKALRVFIVKAGTGGAMFRSLHARFLHDMSRLLEDRQLRTVAMTYDALSTAWERLGAHAEIGDHARGIEPVAEIRRLEPMGVSMMKAWTEGAR